VINHYAANKACRVKLLTLEVATTGSVQISATSTGYARASGSFLNDGIVSGMEVTGVGFGESGNNTAKTITSVTAATITSPGTVVEAAGSRVLKVVLPLQRAWENKPLDPANRSPYVQEEYIPGPMTKISVGALGQLEILPLYVMKIFVPSNTGMGAARSYSDALLTLFAPGTSLTVADASAVVRSDVAPFVGQFFQDATPGFGVVPVSVPIRIRTANSI